MPIGFRVVLLPRLLSLFVEPVRSVSGCLLERTTMHARVHSERRALSSHVRRLWSPTPRRVALTARSFRRRTA